MPRAGPADGHVMLDQHHPFIVGQDPAFEAGLGFERGGVLGGDAHDVRERRRRLVHLAASLPLLGRRGKARRRRNHRRTTLLARVISGS